MKSVAAVFGLVSVFLPWVSYGSPQNETWRADVPLCIGCHGAHGEGATTGVPRLAGQDPQYMSHALSMFKAGTRDSPVMQPIAQGLSDADMSALAAYFSNQNAPMAVANAPVSSEALRAGKQLAEAGATACFSCHGPGGRGNGSRYPSIAGQPARFVIDRLHEFQQRAMKKPPMPGSMTFIAARMSEKEIEVSAAYLSRLAR